MTASVGLSGAGLAEFRSAVTVVSAWAGALQLTTAPAAFLHNSKLVRQYLSWVTGRNTCGEQIKSALPPTGDLSKTSYTCRDGPTGDLANGIYRTFIAALGHHPARGRSKLGLGPIRKGTGGTTRKLPMGVIADVLMNPIDFDTLGQPINPAGNVRPPIRVLTAESD